MNQLTILQFELPMSFSSFPEELPKNSTPMHLLYAESPLSSLHPRVLIFSGENQLMEAVVKRDIEFLYGSRLYESFDVSKRESPLLQSFDIQENGGNELNSDLLHGSHEIVPSLSRKGSIAFANEQLSELKRNVDRLITIISSRNPEEMSNKGQLNQGRTEERQKLQAKSTQSQNVEENPNVFVNEVRGFESPQRINQLNFSDISPISHKWQGDREKRSNVCCASSRSLMQSKMRSKMRLEHQTA